MMIEGWEKLGTRIAEAARDEFVGFCLNEARLLSKICESPIEVLLGAAIMVCGHLESRYLFGCEYILSRQEHEKDFDENAFLLIPQFKWNDYRFDFAIASSEMRKRYVFIEC